MSAATERLHAQVRAIGPHYRTALITGERGARKEEVARALHAASPAAGRPFVVCDSGLMEALVKGKEADAGAGVGGYLIEATRGGTVFFPELGLFSLAAQTEVLQLLDRLAEERGERIRVIASASGDLHAMVAGGTLWPELRERIGAIELAVAPLRERLEDIQAVASQLLERAGRGAAKISEGALRELQRRGWPGNDRELESALRIAALASGGDMIEDRHLPPAATRAAAMTTATAPPAISSLRLQDVVDSHVQNVLCRCEGNKFKAAEVLGISRSTLYRMLDAATVGQPA